MRRRRLCRVGWCRRHGRSRWHGRRRGRLHRPRGHGCPGRPLGWSGRWPGTRSGSTWGPGEKGLDDRVLGRRGGRRASRRGRRCALPLRVRPALGVMRTRRRPLRTLLRTRRSTVGALRTRRRPLRRARGPHRRTLLPGMAGMGWPGPGVRWPVRGRAGLALPRPLALWPSVVHARVLRRPLPTRVRGGGRSVATRAAYPPRRGSIRAGCPRGLRPRAFAVRSRCPGRSVRAVPCRTRTLRLGFGRAQSGHGGTVHVDGLLRVRPLGARLRAHGWRRFLRGCARALPPVRGLLPRSRRTAVLTAGPVGVPVPQPGRSTPTGRLVLLLRGHVPASLHRPGGLVRRSRMPGPGPPSPGPCSVWPPGSAGYARRCPGPRGDRAPAVGPRPRSRR